MDYKPLGYLVCGASRVKVSYRRIALGSALSKSFRALDVPNYDSGKEQDITAILVNHLQLYMAAGNNHGRRSRTRDALS